MKIHFPPYFLDDPGQILFTLKCFRGTYLLISESVILKFLPQLLNALTVTGGKEGSLVFKAGTITVFDQITAHTPISTQSRNSVVFRLQPVYFFVYFFTKAYVVGTHLNCIDKSMQFK